MNITMLRIIKQFYPLLLCIAALVAAFIVITGHEADYLACVEEQSLFLDTPLFFRELTAVPGGLLSYVSCWFTEYLHDPTEGTPLICFWCGLTALLFWRTYRLQTFFAPLLLVPVAAVLLTQFMPGYWIYLLKFRGFFFAAPIGFSLALLLAWAFRALARRAWPIRLTLMVLTAAIAYPIAGFYGLLAVAIMAVMEWRMDDTTSQKIALTAVAALLLIGVPLLYYRYVYCQIAIENIWTCGLPLYAQDEQTYPQYMIPYIALSVLLLVWALSQRWSAPAPEFRMPQKNYARLMLVPLLHVAFIAAVVWGCNRLWYKNDNFHKEIQMTACIDRCDWQGVLDLAAQAESPTRMMVLYRYLALFKMGRAGDEMYRLPDGDQRPDCPAAIPMVQLGGRPLYMHYGVPNFCLRWCVEDGVEFGWRVDNLKYMTRCALLCGEWEAARKYIDLLRHTRHHADWAKAYERLVGQPDLVKSHPELGPALRVMGHHNTLASDKAMLENFLLVLLASLTTDEPEAADLALMSAVQLKDIGTFWRAFNQYARLHPNGKMPRYYQEAAYLYGNLEHTVDISRMPFDQSIVDSYREFMQMAQQCQSMSNEQMQAAFRPRFGDTFYYNYFLLRDLKTY